MKVEAKIQKWGNGLALRVSGVIKDIPHFKEGTIVEVDVNETGFVVTKQIGKPKRCFPFSENELISNLTPELAHSDLLAQPTSKEVGEK